MVRDRSVDMEPVTFRHEDKQDRRLVEIAGFCGQTVTEFIIDATDSAVEAKKGEDGFQEEALEFLEYVRKRLLGEPVVDSRFGLLSSKVVSKDEGKIRKKTVGRTFKCPSDLKTTMTLITIMEKSTNTEFLQKAIGRRIDEISNEPGFSARYFAWLGEKATLFE